MPIRIKLRRKSLAGLLLGRRTRLLFAVAAGLLVMALIGFTYTYRHYARLIDRKLASGPFQSTAMIFAAPRAVTVGDELTPAEVIAQLRRSGYTESRNNVTGWYHLRPDALEIFPGAESYFDQEAGVLKFTGGQVSQIISLRDNTERLQYLLEPELVTNLFDRNREKRRLVKFTDIPKVLVNAVVSAEDKNFFKHVGFDWKRVLKAAYVDVKEGSIEEGASTLTMQLARCLWLDPSQRTWRRKAPEVIITLHLERTLDKQQIFEYYANQIPLGRRGSFNIHGFGEGAQAYLGKDIRELTLPEAALLAGLVQGPSLMNPYRHPERARNRRNIVLRMMKENGYVSQREYEEAVQAPLTLAAAGMESTDAPYFVDLVNNELTSEFQDHDFQSDSYRIYTTLDLNLQRAASEAVQAGLQEIDARMKSRRKRNPNLPDPQVALVALDPETGAVKALIGGRNYGLSQLNRALAKRQPGSAFKPFVFAAAMNSAVNGSQPVFTPASTVLDERTTFWFDNKSYSPDNFKSEFHGEVTLRRALAKSMNVATVKVAQAVGFDTVEELARRAGMNLEIRPTPAIALGAYEVTPVEIAGAYTIFANQGVFLKPNWISAIRDRQGDTLYQHKLERRRVLDPRVAYLMVSMMEEVLRSGTGAGVRSRGFVLPAAGKTGTSHDGWFAGFTSKLICVVWVGFDDNRALNMEGAHSALPIWTEFMKRASHFREYRNAKEFSPPDGIVSVEIDPVTGQLATPSCPTPRSEFFISGTQPLALCRLHGGGAVRVASWESPPALPPSTPTTPAQPPAQIARAPIIRPATETPAQPPVKPQPEKKKEKKGFFGRLLGVFK